MAGAYNSSYARAGSRRVTRYRPVWAIYGKKRQTEREGRGNGEGRKGRREERRHTNVGTRDRETNVWTGDRETNGERLRKSEFLFNLLFSPCIARNRKNP